MLADSTLTITVRMCGCCENVEYDMSSMAIASCQPQHRRQLCIRLVFLELVGHFLLAFHPICSCSCEHTHEAQPWQNAEFFTFCFCEYVWVFGNSNKNFYSSKSPDLDLISTGNLKSGESTQGECTDFDSNSPWQPHQRSVETHE